MTTTVMNDDHVSEDALLGGRVTIRQPRAGYRVAIDPVLLAAAVPVKPGRKVLDAGAGVGAAALCLAARVPGVSLTALEKDPATAALARDNAALNRVDLAVIEGDIAAPPATLTHGAFDHVMANPPYLPEAHGHASPNGLKRTATHESGTDLRDWIAFARGALKHKGTLTLIHRADRLGDVLAAASDGFGDIAVFPLWPKAIGESGDEKGPREASRIVLRARKGIASPLRLLPGLVLHEPDGAYTRAAERILRDGAALIF